MRAAPGWPCRCRLEACRARPWAYVCAVPPPPSSLARATDPLEDTLLRIHGIHATARALAAAGLIVAATATCSDDSITGPGGGSRLTVSAGTPNIFVGDMEQLTATLGVNGTPVTATWSSGDTSIAKVDASGMVRGMRPGTVVIGAVAARSRAAFSLRVLGVVKFGVAVTPAVDSLYVGQSRQLATTVTDSLGLVRTDRTITWSLRDSTLATISAGGQLHATQRGTVTVYGRTGGLSGAADIKVLRHVATLTFPSDTVDVAFGTVRRLEPALADSAGDPIVGRRITWATSDMYTVGVDASGAVQGGAAGVARITAVSEGATGAVYVRVVPRTVSRLSVVVPRTWITVGATMPATVAMWDSTGATTDHHAVTWTSSDTTIATVSATGVVTARAVGSVAVTAESEGRIGFATLDVQLPPASLRFPVDSVVTMLGSVVNLYTLARDSLGNAVQTDAGTWTSSDPSVLAFSFPGTPSTAYASRDGRVTVTATVAGHTATMPVIVSGSEQERLAWEYSSANAGPYTRYDTRVYLQNFQGAAVADRAVTLQTNDSTVATVTPESTRTNANGLVTVTVSTKRPGHVLILATSGTLFATYGVTVVSATPAKVTIGNEPVTLATGSTHRLVATTLDETGQVRTFPLRWSTSDPAVATVSDSGLVSGVAGGIARIVVSADQLAPGAPADTATIVVSAPAAPSVSAISPAELRPGESAVITGANFSADAATNVVTVNGVRATVTAASATQLSVVLPSAASFGCARTRPVPVVVSTGDGLLTEAMQPLASAPQRTLGIGEAAILAAGERCFELPRGNGVYLVATSNPAPSADARAAATVRGDTGMAVAAAATVAARDSAATTARQWGGSPPGVLRVDLDAVRRAAAMHHRILDANRAIVRRNGAPAPLFARARAAAAGNDSLQALLATTTPAVGSLSFMRVWAPDADACGGYRTVQVRTVYVGTAVAIAEDVGAPLARQMDDEYRKLGEEFEASMLPLVRANFGDPLAADTQLGLGGRVVLLFTPTVNAMGNVRGYVSGCDFYPTAAAPSSNQAPVLYAIVPTSTSAGFTSGEFTKDVWRHVIRATVVHETKHLASLSERLARGASVFEESWLEEASAMAAMEIWNRAFTGVAWKGRGTYAQDLYCEVRPTMSSCASRPYAMFDHFAFLHDYLASVETHSPLGGTDPGDASFYGSGWALLRWSVDQYAGNEAAFFRALTQETRLAGVANLEARTGHPFAEMSVDWATATALDVHYGLTYPTSRAQLTLPSWNVRNVFQGMAADFPQYFGSASPSPFRTLYCALPPVGAPVVRGGSSAFFELSTCSGWKNFYDVTAPGGAPISVEIVHLQ